MAGASIITPFFVWFYLLVALVLFVNLLIAMFVSPLTTLLTTFSASSIPPTFIHFVSYTPLPFFALPSRVCFCRFHQNAEFEQVMAKADANVRLAKVNQVEHYIACFPVPPPLNVPAMLLLWLLQLGFIAYNAVQIASGRLKGSFRRRKRQGRGSRNREEVDSVSTTLKGWLQHSRKILFGDSPPERHYPESRLHLRDFEVEGLLDKAREKYRKKREFDQWRAEESARSRFERMEATLQNQFDKIHDAVRRDTRTDASPLHPSTPERSVDTKKEQRARAAAPEELRSEANMPEAAIQEPPDIEPSPALQTPSQTAPVPNEFEEPKASLTVAAYGLPSTRSPVAAAFDRIDANGDGSITRAELTAEYKRVAGDMHGATGVKAHRGASGVGQRAIPRRLAETKPAIPTTARI